MSRSVSARSSGWPGLRLGWSAAGLIPPATMETRRTEWWRAALASAVGKEGPVPKIVDHDQRRRELVETTWRVIAGRGLSGATMRQIAEEAGFANGALKPYFPTKADLLKATYSHVFERTEHRIDAAVGGLRGLDALRALCLEVLPVNAELVDEARLVISFWEDAARNPNEARLASGSLDRWRDRMLRMLAEAHDDGRLRASVDAGATAELLLGHFFGSQVTAVMDAENFGPERLRVHLEAFLDLLRA